MNTEISQSALEELAHYNEIGEYIDRHPEIKTKLGPAARARLNGVHTMTVEQMEVLTDLGNEDPVAYRQLFAIQKLAIQKLAIQKLADDHMPRYIPITFSLVYISLWFAISYLLLFVVPVPIYLKPLAWIVEGIFLVAGIRNMWRGIFWPQQKLNDFGNGIFWKS